MVSAADRPPDFEDLTAGIPVQHGRRDRTDKEGIMFCQIRSRVGSVWCNAMHESIMWPAHGHYECRTCGRRYPAFTQAERTAQSPDSRRLPLTTRTPRAVAGLSRT